MTGLVCFLVILLSFFASVDAFGEQKRLKSVQRIQHHQRQRNDPSIDVAYRYRYRYQNQNQYQYKSQLWKIAVDAVKLKTKTRGMEAILVRKVSVSRSSRTIVRIGVSILTTMLLTTRKAMAATTKVSTTPIRRTIQTLAAVVFLYISITALLENRNSQRRQAKDPTSEWSRYASNPGARGRAVVMIGLSFLPIWIKQIFCSKEEKHRLWTKSGEHFAESLLKLGPLYIKLGQIMSCREKLLPKEWTYAMERLQDRVPAKSGKDAIALAYSAIGSRERFNDIFLDFDTKPLAAASLGQVHKAVLRRSNSTVAIKLQRPFLRQIYDQDLVLLLKIANIVDKIGGVGSQVGGVSQSWTQIFQDAKKILYREIDYNDEADNAIRFSNDFGLGIDGSETIPAAKSKDNATLPSAASWLRSPFVYKDLSSEKVLVMEFVPSIKITNMEKLAAANVTQADKEYLASSLARAYLRSFCANQFFSTDPHPGNLGVEVLPGKPPRVVMYDFGQACSLKSDQAQGILDVIEAIIDMDSNRCVDAFVKMGVMKEGADMAKVRAKVQNNFETGKIQVKRKKLKKAGYIFKNSGDVEITSTLVEGNGNDGEVMSFFTLPAEYAFVARAIAQMDGVGKALDPEFDFISSAAPHIVEIKGTTSYVSDELNKWIRNTSRKIIDWQQSLGAE